MILKYSGCYDVFAILYVTSLWLFLCCKEQKHYINNCFTDVVTEQTEAKVNSLLDIVIYDLIK
jgi:hypothetical protein